jgi:hypothetical protein
MKKVLFILMGLFIGSTALGQVNSNSITSLLVDHNYTKGYSFYNVPIATTVNYSSLPLTLTGTGVAMKKFGITRIKVFVIQYFTQYPEKFVRTETGALKSIENTGYTAMKLTFIRGVDSTMVRDSINDYLTNNIEPSEYPQYKNDIATILNAISGDDSFVYGSSITIVGFKNHILYEDTKGKVTIVESINNDLTTKIYGMFLGKVTNDEGYSLKLRMIEDPSITFGNLK